MSMRYFMLTQIVDMFVALCGFVWLRAVYHGLCAGMWLSAGIKGFVLVMDP